MPRPGLQAVTWYTSYTHLDPLLTRCPCCQYSQPKCPGDLDLLTLKVMSESRVTWFTSVPNLVFLGLSILDLGPMYVTDRHQTDRRQTVSSLNAAALTTLSTFFDSVRWIHLAFVKMCPGLLGAGIITRPRSRPMLTRPRPRPPEVNKGTWRIL